MVYVLWIVGYLGGYSMYFFMRSAPVLAKALRRFYVLKQFITPGYYRLTLKCVCKSGCGGPVDTGQRSPPGMLTDFY